MDDHKKDAPVAATLGGDRQRGATNGSDVTGQLGVHL
jgi:hypothetical protein